MKFGIFLKFCSLALLGVKELRKRRHGDLVEFWSKLHQNSTKYFNLNMKLLLEIVVEIAVVVVGKYQVFSPRKNKL